MRAGIKRPVIRMFRSGLILASVCVLATSCKARTSHATPGEIIKSGESAANTEPAKSSEQAITETASTEGTPDETAASAEETLGETGVSEEKYDTFSEISELLYQQGMQWEAYYNVSGERIDMYLEDGSNLMFLCSEKVSEDTKLDHMILVMHNDQFFTRGFQAGYRTDLVQSADMEYFPQTAEYYLSETELTKMSQTDLMIALQEIYARHGKRISEPFLRAVFELKTWYAPEYEEDDFAGRQETLLNRYEKENIKAISATQKERGFTDDPEVDYKAPRSVVGGSSIDLDGDGTREKLLFYYTYAGPYAMVKECLVKIDPKDPSDFKIVGTIDQMPPAVYAASLDGKTTQLIMCGKMNDGRPRTEIYVYQDGEANLAGQIDAGNLEIRQDCFWAYQYDEQQIRLERAKYIFNHGTVMATGVTEAVEYDESGQDNRMRTLIDSFDFEHSRIGYSEVEAALERIGVSWESTPNISGERMDLICDDGTALVLMETGLAEKELIMAGNRLSEKGFQRVFIHEQIAKEGEFYYPQTSERLLSGYELSRMRQTELSVARNEIYARHGRRFENPFLHAVFSRKSWYKPKYDGEEFSAMIDQLLNEFEKKNLLLLVAAEEELAER